ncbi:MAG: tetratricopeptide repeat protein [Aureispira sp.]|nr:tetratricopeptide repeat protein [Aureispira sp.]
MKTWLLCLITLTLFLGVQHSTAQQQIDTSRITSSEYSIVQLDSVLDAYMTTQQLAEAEKWAVYAMDQVTKMDLKKLNPNTPEYLAFSKIYSVTMATYSRAENYDAISELCKHLIRKFDKVLGLTDPYYEQLVSYYQAIARNTGNTDQLIEANTVQKKIYKIKGWEETEVYLRLLLEVADLHLTKGDFSTSFDSYEYAEPIIARVKGEKSYEYMLWLNKMGEWYRLMGMFDEAIYHFKKAVQTSIYLGGGKDYSTASLMINLGRAYSSQNNYQSADTLYSKAINIYKKLPTNEQLTIAYNTALSMRMDNYVNELLWRDFKGEVIFEDELEDSEMENICHEVLAFRKKYFGTDHPEYANALVGLYKLRFAQKKYWEADKYLKKALSIREKYLGEKHFDYLELLFESCKIAEITGDIDLAVQNYRKANKLNLAILNNNFLTQTEDQRMQLLSRLDNKIIYFYSFAARHVRSYPSLAKDVIDVEIALKGLVLEDVWEF